MDGEVCWGDLARIAVDERHWHARIRQPNLHSVVGLDERREVDKGVPPRVHLVYPVEPVFPRGAENSTILRSALY